MVSSHAARRLTDDEQQRITYDTRRQEWIEKSATAIAKRMRSVSADEKRRMWAACSIELRKELKRIAA